MTTETKTVTDITRDAACDRITLFATERRLRQRVWHGTANDGRELACLLGAINPAVNKPRDCPASVMPAWMAKLVMTLFDGVAADKATPLGLRFAEALRTGSTDDSVRDRWLAITVQDAQGSAEKAAAAATAAAWAAATAAEEAAAASWAARAATAAAWAAEAAAEAAEAAATAAEAAAEAAAAAAVTACYERLFVGLIEEMTRTQ